MVLNLNPFFGGMGFFSHAAFVILRITPVNNKND